ncbi:MAG: response regulator [Magnetococcales bacterium]|nr:response regulator [Magnetococcales bacterium]
MDTILLVEDSWSFAQLLQSRIQSALEIQVVVAKTMAEASERIVDQHEHFFLAILDLNLPDAPDGQIVDLVISNHVPVIVLTGLFNKNLQEKIQRWGVLDYFIKDNIGVIDSVIHSIERIRRNKKIDILVVDDSRSVRVALQGFLMRYGFQVHEAADGAQALQILDEQNIHLIISDYEMPEVNGIAMTKKMRAQYSRNEVALIGFSSNDNQEIAVQFIKAGANDFLVKPYQPEELLCRVYQNIEIIERHRETAKLLSHHQSILSHALDAIITIDQQGKVLNYNPAAEELFGYKKADILGQNIADFIVPECYREQHQAAMERFQKQWKEPVTLQRRLELPGLRADGKIVDLQISLTVVAQDEGINFIAFIQDITARKQLMKSLEETLTAAESANRAKSDFIANVSHEIRTPMNAVLGFTDLALKRDAPVQIQDYLEKIENASRSLMGIINDLLDFSKMEVGRMELDPVKFDLGQLLNRMADLFSRQVSDKRIDLVLRIDPVNYDDVLFGDVMRIEQILINLIRNAVKFTKTGSIVVTVRPKQQNNKKINLDFSVRDTGIGVEPEALDRLFDPFVQADGSTTRKYGGTGLGLSICSKLVNMMDGRIWAESAPGEGSEFFFNIIVEHYGLNSRLHPELTSDLSGQRILIADDNLDSCHHLSAILTAAGMSTTTVNSGADVVMETVQAVVEKQPFVLALIDWDMAGMSGVSSIIEMQAALAAHSPTVQPPATFLMIDFGIDDARAEAEVIGIDGIIDKPITMHRLIRTLSGDGHAKGSGTDRRLKKVLGQESETGLRIGGCRILLVDDNIVNQQVARELLERIGLVVETASSGKEALALIKYLPFDAVLMDIQMPEWDGFQTTEKIRQDPSAKNLPIIAMTAHSLPEEKKRFADLGVSYFLDKPIRTERLYGSLDKVIPAERRLMAFDQPGIVLDLFDETLELKLESRLKRFADNTLLYQKLLLRFAREHTNSIKELSEFWRLDGREELSRLVHVIQTGSDALGISMLFQTARDLEQALIGNAQRDENRKNQQQALVNALKHKLEQFLIAVMGDSKKENIGSPIDSSAKPETLNNPEQFSTLFESVIDHIKANDFESSALLAELLEQVELEGCRPILEEIKQQVQLYNFEEALVALQVLQRNLGIAALANSDKEERPTGRSRVLIVDDQRSNVDVLREILTDYDRIIALGGVRALELARTEPQPDIILLDIMMPVIDGYEVCKQLKDDPATAGIPVIFVTAKKEVGDEARGFHLGGTDYITKPFNSEIVRQRIKNQLELKKHRDHLESLVARRTEQLVQARKEAEQGREAAEAGNLAKSRFLATMSHEIRTPMNAILGMADALGETSLNEEQRQFVTVFKRSGQGLLGLIDGILDLSKVESGKLELEQRPFRLSKLLQSTLDMMEVRAAEKGLKLSMVVDETLPKKGVGDPHRIQQIVVNLLFNAIKFTQRGSVILRARACHNHAESLRVEIEDTGIGIPEEKMENIFQDFAQVDASITRSHGGTGLGLAICKKLVDLMGGEIGVTSQIGKGSLFHVIIPYPPSEQTKREPFLRYHSEDQVRPKGTERASILLVDDTEDNILLVEVFLKSTPHTITVAWDGQEALDQLTSKRFDLVLMDIQMPRMDGYTATRKLREYEQKNNLPRTPVAALTAHAMAEDAQRARDAGCDEFLSKPITKKKLIKVIDSMLNRVG